jgi:hypothetical protein
MFNMWSNDSGFILATPRGVSTPVPSRDCQPGRLSVVKLVRRLPHEAGILLPSPQGTPLRSTNDCRPGQLDVVCVALTRQRASSPISVRLLRSVLPAKPQPRQPDPQGPVMPTQTRALHGALQYAMLPAQRQILRGERAGPSASAVIRGRCRPLCRVCPVTQAHDWFDRRLSIDIEGANR